MIVTGDPTQIDLPPGQKSGLIEAMRILDGVEGIGRIIFSEQDVVRHDLVRRIVTAYDAAARRNRARGAAAVIALDIIVEAGAGPRLGDAEALARTRRRGGARGRGCAARTCRVSLLLTDDAPMRALNRAWRGKDKPTNVLSFPASAQPGGPGPSPSRRCRARLRDPRRARPQEERKDLARPRRPSRRPRRPASPRLRSRDRGRGGNHGGSRGEGAGQPWHRRPLPRFGGLTARRLAAETHCHERRSKSQRPPGPDRLRTRRARASAGTTAS